MEFVNVIRIGNPEMFHSILTEEFVVTSLLQLNNDYSSIHLLLACLYNIASHNITIQIIGYLS